MLDIEANAFLYHMVCNIAGSLIAVGKGDDLQRLGTVLNPS